MHLAVFFAVLALLPGAPVLPGRADGPQARPAPPAVESIERERQRVRAQHGIDTTQRGPAARRALAEGLLDLGRGCAGPPERCFALLEEARLAAIAAREGELALDAAEALGQRFDLPVRELAIRTAVDALPLAPRPRFAALARRLLDLAGACREVGQYEHVLELVSALQGSAFWGQHPELNPELEALAVWARRAQLVEQLEARLAADPEDPEARLALGKLLCFELVDATRGLELLAGGADSELASLVAQDLAGPATGEARLALGQRWAALVEVEPQARRFARLRAADWMEQALPLLEPGERRSARALLLGLRLTAEPTDGLFGAEQATRRPSLRLAANRAAAWLRANQAEEGYWEPAEQDGPERARAYRTGLTGLVVLALISSGSPGVEEAALRGLGWLMAQQDDSGWIGPGRLIPENLGDRIAESASYGHALGSLALAEAFRRTGHPLLESAAGAALQRSLAGRNYGMAWGYANPANGENRTMISAWMTDALAAGSDAGLEVDREVFYGAVQWVEEMTSPMTGRTGYGRGFGTGRGERSVRATEATFYSTDGVEALTAAGLVVRAQARRVLGLTGEPSAIEQRSRALVLDNPPRRSSSGEGNDFLYWYFGARATLSAGEAPSPRTLAWVRGLEFAAQATQREGGELDGSCDPDDPWGFIGGRAYSTAVMLLILTHLLSIEN